MNLDKGLKRLTLVISIIAPIIFMLILAGDIHNLENFIVAFLMPFTIVWLLYFMVKFIVRGFKSDSQNSPPKQ